MNLYENIILALNGLRTSKMRALLTMLGIIIGIGSVIAIVTVGNALTGSITGSMQGLGVNNIMVGIQQKNVNMGVSTDNVSVSPTEDDLISDEMIEALQLKYADEIEAVSLTQSAGGGKAQDGRRYANVTLMGVNPGYSAANSMTIQKGRFLADRDIQGNKAVAVVSDKLVSKMFPGNIDPLGQEIKIYTTNEILTYMIIGVYQYEDSAMNFSMAGEDEMYTNLFIPISTAQKMVNADSGYDMFTVTALPGVDAQRLSVEISNFLDVYYQNNTQFGITSMSMETMLGYVNEIMGTVSIAVAVIAAISLVVGGIGVMNIMLVSVTERTREIGTRKALGARGSAIRIQFIVESMIICLIGGIIGIVVGFLLGNLGAIILGAESAEMSASAVAIAVIFSTVIGIFFGYYPANKAAKLDPIEALRYE